MNKNSTSSDYLKSIVKAALAAGNYGSPKESTLRFLRNLASGLNTVEA